MTTFEERMLNAAFGMFAESHGTIASAAVAWSEMSERERAPWRRSARAAVKGFLDGDPVYEWANLPDDRSAGWVDLTAMRDELIEDGVLVRLEVPE